MKKILFLSLAASATLFASTTTIKLAKIDCINGTKGFEAEVTKTGIDEKVTYNHCNSKGIEVVVGEENVDPGETVNIDGEDIFFPNGYTEPTVAACRFISLSKLCLKSRGSYK